MCENKNKEAQIASEIPTDEVTTITVNDNTPNTTATATQKTSGKTGRNYGLPRGGHPQYHRNDAQRRNKQNRNRSRSNNNEFGWSKKYGNYDAIQREWANNGTSRLMGVTQSGRAYTMNLFADGTALVAIEGGGEIENRDYLELAERVWNDGAPSGRRLLKTACPISNALTNVQTNAYPYSNPVFVDDGSMFLYISDNDNPDELQSVVSYAVRNGSGYMNKGAVDTSDGNILADSDVVASGTEGNVFAAWIKQMESPEKEMHDKTTYDDLGMMMNATEIYAGVYTGSDWTTERLTTNNVADTSSMRSSTRIWSIAKIFQSAASVPASASRGTRSWPGSRSTATSRPSSLHKGVRA